jgi:hypothetical protein
MEVGVERSSWQGGNGGKREEGGWKGREEQGRVDYLDNLRNTHNHRLAVSL